MATNIFTKETGRKLAALKQIREKSDYDDFYIISREKATEQYETAKLVLQNVEEYLKQHLAKE